MLPSSILLRNYRCFPGPEELELRPITLLYGGNNAGKSALLRTLPLLADSVATDGLDALELSERLAPLELDFDTLRRKGRAAEDDHDIGLGLVWPAGAPASSVEWSLVEEPDWHRIVVSRLRVTTHDGTTTSLSWVPRREDERSSQLMYDTGQLRAPLELCGLLPRNIASVGPLNVVRHAASSIEALKGAVLWLRSLRPAPKRFTRWTGAARWEVKPDGSDAPIVLASEPELQDEVSSWYEEHFRVKLVIDEPRKREIRTLLRQRFDIDLADTGEGMSQCLPVLVALAMARRHRERGGPGILAIEEPEAHLHPRLQRALAEKICEIAAAARPRIIMETHSEHILLTVQLAVVTGRVRPEDVVIYWIRSVEQGQSTVSKIELDADGRFVGAWPPAAFDEDHALAAEILDARDARSRAGCGRHP